VQRPGLQLVPYITLNTKNPQCRYDYRKNLYDWDYNFHFKDLASVIHKKLFMQWRDEGIAFEIRESKYPEPNRTMASYAEGKEKVMR